ncbi:hypothetical protein ABS767_14610 [Sphingomonas sp. ST-64]|uniref:Uncharacterized protein n=1 Tax=Sphingomonas plantiphila TaxID=3163295 RepID=A0ABW8YPH4_9SPHN
MSRLLMLVLLAAVPAAAQDAPDGEPDALPQRVRSVLLYGEDTCPKPTSPDEVVVCAKVGESPFRIPKSLRKSEPGPGGTSWVRRAELVDEVNRATLPGACNPIGSFGQSGCTLQMIQRWKAEQREKKAEEAAIPGGED